MPGIPQLVPRVLYPGINGIISFTYTRTHGIAHQCASVQITPQQGLPDIEGNMTLTDGQTSINLGKFRVDLARLQRDQNGHIVQVLLMDRRWKWQFGRLSGEYNIWKDATNFADRQTVDNRADIVDGTGKTPQQLLKLLAEAMGEKIDVSKVPNTAAIYVNWNNVVPMRAMSDLADQLGCRVILRSDDVVAVAPAGQGDQLPSGYDIVVTAETIDLPEKPDKINIVCGPHLINGDFELEAIGIDADGTYKLIDDLSYKPEAGWGTVDIENFNAIQDLDHREKARQSVFRLYRVKSLKGQDQLVIRGRKIQKNWQFLPLQDEQVVTFKEDTPDGEIERIKKAQIWGVYFQKEKNGNPHDNTVDKLKPIPYGVFKDDGTYAKETLYQKEFDIDMRAAIVRFREPLFRWGDDPKNKGGSQIRLPAQIVLRTSFCIRDFNTREFVRHQKTRDISQLPPGPTNTLGRFDVHEELFVKKIIVYNDDYSIQSVQDNATETNLNKFMDYYLDCIQAEYQREDSLTAHYATLRDIQLDGAVQQVTWAFDLNSGMQTTAYRNNETARNVLTYRQLRYAQRTKDAADTAAREKKGSRNPANNWRGRKRLPGDPGSEF